MEERFRALRIMTQATTIIRMALPMMAQMMSKAVMVAMVIIMVMTFQRLSGHRIVLPMPCTKGGTTRPNPGQDGQLESGGGSLSAGCVPCASIAACV
jgi:hypothetical protein